MCIKIVFKLRGNTSNINDFRVVVWCGDDAFHGIYLSRIKLLCAGYLYLYYF